MIYIVDAVGFLFRSYYAIQGMTAASGESTNALFGFIRSLLKLVHEKKPTHLIAVFDGPDNKRSRQKIYKAYKEHRIGAPEDLFAQFEKAETFCKLFGIPTLTLEGVEADDTMAAIATFAASQGKSAYLCTSDKDLYQLISDKIFVLKENLIIDREKVIEIYGVPPEQMRDLLALMGDTSDNVPGVYGIGPKGAAKLLNEFGTLEAIYQHLPEKFRQKLLEGKENAFLSQELVTLDLHVPIPRDFDFYKLKPPQTDGLRAMFLECGFRTLLSELEPPAAEIVDYHIVEGEAALHAMVEELLRFSEVVVDTKPSGIAFSAEKRRAFFVPFQESVRPHLDRLFSSHISWIGHYLKFDLHALANLGFFPTKISFDTLIASYLLRPDLRGHSLEELCLEFFNYTKSTTDCCEDADYTLRLKEVLQLGDLEILFREIELPLLLTLFKMERRGIFLESSKLQEIGHSLGEKISVLEKKIYALAGEEFNLNSPKQLAHILFEKLAMKPPRGKKVSTAADVLEALRNEHPIIPLVLEFRQLDKLKSTYVDPLPTLIDPKTGRIHCTFSQTTAATGRLACQNPNLQNIPVRSEEGAKIRACFRPQKEGWSYLSFDYSQIELRLLAHFSGDPKLLAAFQKGEDIHRTTAAQVFDVPLEHVTSEMRASAKAVNFGIIYGQGAYGLSQQLGIAQKEALQFIDTYFSRYPSIHEYLHACEEAVRKTGVATTLFGRKRPIGELSSSNPQIRALGSRLAINTPLQGTAADLIKIAMNQIETQLIGFEGFMILQIHDELIFEVPDHELEPLTPIIRNILQNVVQLKVPLLVDVSVGKNWGEC